MIINQDAFSANLRENDIGLMRLAERTKVWDLVEADHTCESDGKIYTSYPPQWKCKICGKFYKIGD